MHMNSKQTKGKQGESEIYPLEMSLYALAEFPSEVARHSWITPLTLF